MIKAEDSPNRKAAIVVLIYKSVRVSCQRVKLNRLLLTGNALVSPPGLPIGKCRTGNRKLMPVE